MAEELIHNGAAARAHVLPTERQMMKWQHAFELPKKRPRSDGGYDAAARWLSARRVYERHRAHYGNPMRQFPL